MLSKYCELAIPNIFITKNKVKLNNKNSTSTLRELVPISSQGEERESALDTSPVLCRAHTLHSCLDSHLLRQFRVFNDLNMHVFRLKEKTGAAKCHNGDRYSTVGLRHKIRIKGRGIMTRSQRTITLSAINNKLSTLFHRSSH